MKLTGPTEVFCHPDAFAPKYAERQGRQRYIGMRKSREEYEQMGARNEGLLVILGCAHSSMINTIEHAMKITGESRILGVVGGTHLGFGGVRRERLARTIEALKAYDLRLLAVSHCTGLLAACELAEEYKDRFLSNNAGTIIEI